MIVIQEFIRFFDIQRKFDGYALEIYFSSIMDWCITIGYKSTHPKHGETIVHVQDCDVEYVFAKAYVEFKEWLMKNNGGY